MAEEEKKPLKPLRPVRIGVLGFAVGQYDRNGVKSYLEQQLTQIKDAVNKKYPGRSVEIICYPDSEGVAKMAQDYAIKRGMETKSLTHEPHESHNSRIKSLVSMSDVFIYITTPEINIDDNNLLKEWSVLKDKDGNDSGKRRKFYIGRFEWNGNINIPEQDGLGSLLRGIGSSLYGLIKKRKKE